MKRRRFIILSLLGILLLWPGALLAAPAPADGAYTIEVTLSGGSGRASVESPAPLTVAGGQMTATLVWSSPHYEYMTVDGVRYAPLQTEGNSTFEIPVALDADLPVSALTIAMSEPHEIDYTLRFDSATLKPAAGGNETVVLVVTGAAAILVTVLIPLAVRRGGGAAGKKAGGP